MFSALIILLLLVLTTPLAVVFDGLIIQGLFAAIAVLSVTLVALKIRQNEAAFLSSVIRPFAIVAAVPAMWMLIQVLPAQSFGLAHPIWKSASATLGHSIAGSISIDPGATLVSLVRYLSAATIAFAAACIATDRRRAEWVLLGLMTSATLMALLAVVSKNEVFTLFDPGTRQSATIIAVNGASLGTVFATAAALLSAERGRFHRSAQDRSTVLIWPLITLSLIELGVCLIVVVVQGTSQTYFAVFSGLATFAVVMIIKRFNLGPWGIAAILSITLFIVVTAFALQPGRMPDFPVRFADHAPTPLIAVTQRALSEVSWVGTGAGTFAAVIPIYESIDELGIGRIAPTAAAALAIEMGWPIFWAILMVGIALVFLFLRAALRRQRDSYYSTTGAGCTVASLLMSLSNSALLTTAISTLVAVAIGVAIAQSKSRLR